MSAFAILVPWHTGLIVLLIGAVYWLAPKTALRRSIAVQTMPFLPLAAATVAIAGEWDRLPERIPSHWGLTGHPDHWVPKTWAHALSPLVVGGVMCIALAALNRFCQISMRRIVPSGPGAEKGSEYRGNVGRIILASEFLISCTFGAIAVVPLVGPGAASRILTALPFAVVVTTVGIFLWSVRSAHRRRVDAAAAPAGPRPDSCWKAGIFYVNHDDPAWIVAKRMGFGYTLNFARVGAWVLIAAILLLSFALRWVITGR